MSFFSKIKSIVSETGAKVSNIFGMKRVNLSEVADLEEELIKADFGVQMTAALLDSVRKNKPNDINEYIKQAIKEALVSAESDLLSRELSSSPYVILVVGVNGNGKTTTVAKLANYYQNKGHRVRVAACDTFRAAAVEQLKKWANEIKCDITVGKENGDPAGVAFGAYKDSEKANNDILIIDTAGRLHTRSDLMDELLKIKKVLKKLNENIPHETVLVLDGTTGEAAFSQIQNFQGVVDLDSVIVTKMDSSSKGGAIVRIAKEYHKPISAICFGEGINDIKSFSSDEYIKSIFE